MGLSRVVQMLCPSDHRGAVNVFACEKQSLFAVTPWDSQHVATAVPRAWKHGELRTCSNNSEALADGKRQILTASLMLSIEEPGWMRQCCSMSPWSIADSCGMCFLPEYDQRCLQTKLRSRAHNEMSLRITPRSQHHTPRAADSHLAIWSTKPGGPRVIQEAWKAAKWVPISKAVEQVEAWQQVFCSCWPSENTQKGVEEG